MHEGNRRWWMECKQKYPWAFSGTSVIELGSANISGTVRDYFAGCKYVGVDWRESGGVDVVSLVHDLTSDKLGGIDKFSTVISASMLEHDPYWEKSLRKMVELMKDDGALFLSWGAAENCPHHHYTAPDNEFHPLPAGKVLNKLADLGVKVHRFIYEESLTGGPGSWGADPGCVALVAFKDERLGHGPVEIAELKEGDKAA